MLPVPASHPLPLCPFLHSKCTHYNNTLVHTLTTSFHNTPLSSAHRVILPSSPCYIFSFLTHPGLSFLAHLLSHTSAHYVILPPSPCYIFSLSSTHPVLSFLAHLPLTHTLYFPFFQPQCHSNTSPAYLSATTAFTSPPHRHHRPLIPALHNSTCIVLPGRPSS